MKLLTRFLEFVFGANWRTTLSGAGVAFMSLLAALAAAPSELGDISTIFPPEWKGRLFAIGAFSAWLLKLINSAMQKDRQVTGNDSAINPNRVNDGSLTGRIVKVVILALIPAFLFTSCVTGADGKQHLKPLTPAQQTKLMELEAKSEDVIIDAASAAASAAAQSAGSQLIDGGNVDGQQVAQAAEGAAIAAGLRAVLTPTKTAIADSASNYTSTPGTPGPLIVATAPTLSTAITSAVNSGVPKSLAIEAAAKGADAATRAISAP